MNPIQFTLALVEHAKAQEAALWYIVALLAGDLVLKLGRWLYEIQIQNLVKRQVLEAMLPSQKQVEKQQKKYVDRFRPKAKAS